MGLCKCPKRKVTNQFCFEHRVNVCEHCMVSNHPKVNKILVESFNLLNIILTNDLILCEYSVWCSPIASG